MVSLPNSLHFRGELESPALPLVQFGDSNGANSSVDLRYRGRLGDSVVMYVRTGAPAYWRGQVFDTWSRNTGQWTASPGAWTSSWARSTVSCCCNQNVQPNVC